MEAFDVLNMENISNFHLDHSNRYFFLLFKFQDPFISPKKNSSDYRVYGSQNDGLEPRVSTQKSVLQNMHRVPRYWQKCIQIYLFKQNVKNFLHFCQYLRTRCIFFKTDFCVETLGSSRLF